LGFCTIGLYAVGLIVINWLLLYSCRKAILKQKHTKMSLAIAFLYREYKPHMYWWELVEMGRRLVLVGFAVLMRRGSVLQLVWAAGFCQVYLLLQMQASPCTPRAAVEAPRAAAPRDAAFVHA
jgi:hypothetical protein